MVVKRSGRRVPFDRDKLERSVAIALRKRPVAPERVERMLSGVVRQLESLGDTDIQSETIGEMVMDGLRQVDDVAYVRFASVYRNFREAKDFENALAELSSDGEARATTAPDAAHPVPPEPAAEAVDPPPPRRARPAVQADTEAGPEAKPAGKGKTGKAAAGKPPRARRGGAA